MRHVSTILSVLLVFLLALIAFDLVLQFVWTLASGSTGTLPNWLRYLADPSFAAMVACAWVWWTAERRGAHR